MKTGTILIGIVIGAWGVLLIAGRNWFADRERRKRARIARDPDIVDPSVKRPRGYVFAGVVAILIGLAFVFVGLLG